MRDYVISIGLRHDLESSLLCINLPPTLFKPSRRKVEKILVQQVNYTQDLPANTPLTARVYPLRRNKRMQRVPGTSVRFRLVNGMISKDR